MTAGVFLCLLFGGGTGGQEGDAEVGGRRGVRVDWAEVLGAQGVGRVDLRLVGAGRLLDKRGVGTEKLVAGDVNVGDEKVIETVGKRESEELDGGRWLCCD